MTSDIDLIAMHGGGSRIARVRHRFGGHQPARKPTVCTGSDFATLPAWVPQDAPHDVDRLVRAQT